MPGNKRILDVGQCGIDGPRLNRFLTRGFDCTVDRAHTRQEAVDLASKHAYDLVLVNRLLAFDSSPGLDVIDDLHAAHPDLRLMLVSDKADAQEQAVQKGALRGFGKAALGSPKTEELLRSVLESR
jgi:DNA-binding NarL/FixJ family response regulator